MTPTADNPTLDPTSPHLSSTLARPLPHPTLDPT